MSPAVFRCLNCDHRVFPARHLCPRCHGAEFQTEPCHLGTVQELTHSLQGNADGQPDVLQLATIASAAGPVLIARLHGDDIQRGDTVRLVMRDGGIHAEPAKA
ncbi:MAG TPA: zinc ribbon domain-containing protein [Alcaligenes sp.]|nr:zinc ribbon domain-containing protein [Alcaligenes sp.]HRL26279.1 zinc ribbon domain-containing protein [Alcaligenes sp.]